MQRFSLIWLVACGWTSPCCLHHPDDLEQCRTRQAPVQQQQGSGALLPSWSALALPHIAMGQPSEERDKTDYCAPATRLLENCYSGWVLSSPPALLEVSPGCREYCYSPARENWEDSQHKIIYPTPTNQLIGRMGRGAFSQDWRECKSTILQLLLFSSLLAFLW